jgi:hypothetical protein
VTALEAKDVTKSFRSGDGTVTAVKDVMTVANGEFVAIAGHSGSVRPAAGHGPVIQQGGGSGRCEGPHAVTAFGHGLLRPCQALLCGG